LEVTATHQDIDATISVQQIEQTATQQDTNPASQILVKQIEQREIKREIKQKGATLPR